MASVAGNNQSGDDADDNDSIHSEDGLIRRTQVVVDEHSSLDWVQQHFLSSSSVQDLQLYMIDSFSFSTADMTIMMAHIGAMPNLERLALIGRPFLWDNNDNNRKRVPISALQQALTPKMTHLLLDNVNLRGTATEFQTLADSVQKLTNLQSLLFADIELQNQSEQHTTSNSNSIPLLEPLFLSLGKLPALSRFMVSGWGEAQMGTLPMSTLKTFLLEATSLRDLSLSHLSLNSDHCQTIKRLLLPDSNNGTPLSFLRELELQCHLSVEGAMAIAHILEHNHTLEELSLSLVKASSPLDNKYKHNNSNNDNDNNEDYFMIYDEDDLVNDEWQQDMERSTSHDIYSIIAQGVIRSTTLLYFEFDSVNLSTPALQQPFLDMLAGNYSLASVHLKNSNTEEYCLETEIAFYLRLNQTHHRSHVFQCPHCRQSDVSYIYLLEDLKCDEDHLSALYYFLSQRLSLITRSLQVDTSPTSSKQSKRQQQNQNQPLLSRKRKRLYRAAKYNRVSYS